MFFFMLLSPFLFLLLESGPIDGKGRGNLVVGIARVHAKGGQNEGQDFVWKAVECCHCCCVTPLQMQVLSPTPGPRLRVETLELVDTNEREMTPSPRSGYL